MESSTHRNLRLRIIMPKVKSPVRVSKCETIIKNDDLPVEIFQPQPEPRHGSNHPMNVKKGTSQARNSSDEITNVSSAHVERVTSWLICGIAPGMGIRTLMLTTARCTHALYKTPLCRNSQRFAQYT